MISDTYFQNWNYHKPSRRLNPVFASNHLSVRDSTRLRKGVSISKQVRDKEKRHSTTMRSWISMKSRGSLHQPPSREGPRLHSSACNDDLMLNDFNDTRSKQHDPVEVRPQSHSTSWSNNPYVSGIEKLSPTSYSQGQEVANLREKNQVLLDAYQNQEIDIKNLQSIATNAENEIQSMRDELAACHDELRVCKDDLFRLQPVAQFSDTRIKDEFQAICQQIIAWIDTEISLSEQTHPNNQPGQIFSFNGRQDLAQLMRDHHEIGEHLVRYLTHYYLASLVLDKGVYLLGISKHAKAFMRKVETQMANLTPPRGKKHSRLTGTQND